MFSISPFGLQNFGGIKKQILQTFKPQSAARNVSLKQPALIAFGDLFDDIGDVLEGVGSLIDDTYDVFMHGVDAAYDSYSPRLQKAIDDAVIEIFDIGSEILLPSYLRKAARNWVLEGSAIQKRIRRRQMDRRHRTYKNHRARGKNLKKEIKNWHRSHHSSSRPGNSSFFHSRGYHRNSPPPIPRYSTSAVSRRSPHPLPTQLRQPSSSFSRSYFPIFRPSTHAISSSSSRRPPQTLPAPSTRLLLTASPQRPYLPWEHSSPRPSHGTTVITTYERILPIRPPHRPR